MSKSVPKIGIGLLVEGALFNALRELQLRLIQATNNSYGIKQPPHVTVRRPFVPTKIDDVARVCALIDDMAKRHNPIDVTLQSLGCFGDRVCYLAVAPSSELLQVQQSIEEALLKASMPVTESGDAPIFHVTLAHNLTADQFVTAQRVLDDPGLVLPIQARLAKIGLFMEIDDQWVVVYSKTMELQS